MFDIVLRAPASTFNIMLAADPAPGGGGNTGWLCLLGVG